LCWQFNRRSDCYRCSGLRRTGMVTFQHVCSVMPRNADASRPLYPILGSSKYRLKS
jgi:hypothetical protein